MHTDLQTLLVWDGLSLHTDEMPDGSLRCTFIPGGADVAVPVVEETHANFVLADYEQGRYSTRQVVDWLQGPGAPASLLARLAWEDDDKLTDFSVSDDVLRPWLLERLHTQDFYPPEGSEIPAEHHRALLTLLDSFLPDWAHLTVGRWGGSFAGGDSEWGELTVEAP